ncbi:SDR family NAD(P)-dependent oxidoreductase [Chelatococcus asaccharovorans]|uniref:NADP-dependent 3-hydroxy acid dehydrogenase YdfG n=1 Tax=Chelatococcus asaccharovorans TaxID=28210 RepID=A0A2V3U4Z8_9HYPH|nr:SDR family oxidoreductase [Chelatococcus asaccharovorans]MBS7703838.1 SDR family oxidoreductase [Chelatococcus asaccharovorans]PXW57999.1 NADP-dependent 3-hydroxy acid dehydrogenase YdfG [Chelatococcus asaccharovorans]
MSTTARYPDLNAKPVLVTGGADGIGRAVVAAFADQGASVGFIDIDAGRGEALAAELAAAGATVAFAAADLRDIAASGAAIAALSVKLGAFAVLVNNAGHDERHRFDDVTPAYWDDRMAVNLRHMMFVTQAVVPDMRARGGGVVINLSSTSWMQGSPGIIAYTTAKSAVIGFTRSLARELGPDGIRVNAVTPGWVMTERQRAAATPERLARAQERQALKGEIMPDDLAAMVLFLASDGARMCTGQNYIVDAGVV